MIRVLPFFIELALVVFCLVDCAQSPPPHVRNLPKWGWIVLIVIVPLIGSIAWLVAGRPTGTRTPPPPPQRQPARPADTSDIDARLDAELARLDREHEEHLRRWESELPKGKSEPDEGRAAT